MDDLKACPFCGKTDVRIVEHDFADLGKTYGAKCRHCDAQTFQFFETKEAAVDGWNRRAKGEQE